MLRDTRRGAWWWPSLWEMERKGDKDCHTLNIPHPNVFMTKIPEEVILSPNFALEDRPAHLSSILHHLHSTFNSTSRSSRICVNSVSFSNISSLIDRRLQKFCFWAGIPITTSEFTRMFSTHKGLIRASKLREFMTLVLTDMRPWHCQKTCQRISLEVNIRLIHQFDAIKLKQLWFFAFSSW